MEYTAYIRFRISPTLKAQAQAKAKQQKRKISVICRNALKHYINAK